MFLLLYMFRATVTIINRNNCIYAILGTCHSVWMTVWYTRWNENDDAHIVARNM